MNELMMSKTGILQIDSTTRPQYSYGQVVLQDTGETVEIVGYQNLRPAFDGDLVKIVQIDGHGYKVEEILERKGNHQITGILCINSRVVYGANKKGVPIFLFKPADHNYPDLLVASKLKIQMIKAGVAMTNHYAVVKFDFNGPNFWPAGKKLPTGQIANYLGPVGHVGSEYKQVLYRWGLQRASFAKTLKLHDVETKIQACLAECETLSGYPNNASSYYADRDTDLVCSGNNVDENEKDCNNYSFFGTPVFSIDPEGCQDIDDAIHVKDDDGYSNWIEVGIHIADVSYWIREGDVLDLEAQDRLTTIYPPDDRLDMIPEVFSTDICSLVEGKVRMAVSTILTFTHKGVLRPERTKFKKTMIKNSAALSYDEAESLLNGQNPRKNRERLMSRISKSLETLVFISKTRDTHKIIEYFMVLVNQLVAERLLQQCPEKLILRVHQGQKGESAKIFQEKINKDENDITGTSSKNENSSKLKLNEHLRIISMQSAEYVPAVKASKPTHYGLGVNYYTHFTSPIRRYVDLINHRLVKKFLCEEPDQKRDSPKSMSDLDRANFCNTCNDLQKRITIAERQFRLLTLINNWERDIKERTEPPSAFVTTAFITDLSETPYITLYFPEHDFSKRTRIFHRIVDSLLEYSLTKNSDGINDGSSVLVIKHLQNNKTVQLKLLQELSVKIIPNFQGETLAKKIKLEFLDQEIVELMAS